MVHQVAEDLGVKDQKILPCLRDSTSVEIMMMHIVCCLEILSCPILSYIYYKISLPLLNVNTDDDWLFALTSAFYVALWSIISGCLRFDRFVYTVQ